MVGGFVLFALSSLGAALSSSLEALIVFRALEGVFAGCGMVVGMAVIRDLYGGPQAQKLMDYVAMVFGFGPALAPIIGGYLAVHAGWAEPLLGAYGNQLCAGVDVPFLPSGEPSEGSAHAD